jgi:hypothetical protein
MHRLRSGRLGETHTDLLDFTPPKPKWMRWRTYARLSALDEALGAQLVTPALRRLLKCAAA